MTCPYCDWPEFTPFYSLERVAEGPWWRMLAALAGRTLFRRSGKVVSCCRCAKQYAVGRSGAYKIAPHLDARPPVEGGNGPLAEAPSRMALVDEDQAPKWR